ncbi:MAG: excinuclease ABC subunit UvrB [Planctomycetes bacterium]|nr:excinuclease ABC subunit UvrB [Planctomycetota bacterium]
MSRNFQLQSEFLPKGDQPKAIEALVAGMADPAARRILLGVTGSGKTFTLAHVIQKLQVPTLVIAPNKTLAGQLYQEMKELFPHNAVEYFVSYYDYFQPEAYIPSSDTFIEKDARINEQIDRMRNAATASLLARSDVIVVASVSCIYGLGDPGVYADLAVTMTRGSKVRREALMRGLVRTQHSRAEVDFRPGTFRVRGSAVEVWPIHERDRVWRFELVGDDLDEILVVDPLTGELLDEPERVTIYPVGHYVQPEDKMPNAMISIRQELDLRLRELHKQGRELEAERLERRTLADLEDLEELGFCSGIENYSRHFEGRSEGQPPFTLLHYLPRNFLCVLDESHVTLPQVYSMVRGDAARKKSLVNYGFRLPSAVDNRPLQEEEFESLVGRVMYVSATPGYRERGLINGAAPGAMQDEDGDFSPGDYSIVEQVVRPTGLLDPMVEIRPAAAQVEDACKEARAVVANGERVLVTTLTKRSAEDLTEFFQESGLRARYLHSDIHTLERAELLRDLRLGVFDVLVGINLLREGLDLPEVALVTVLDADQEGFLRSTTSLIQTCGRAARNVNGKVILYADKKTEAIRQTMAEADRRREIQHAYNLKHGITPRTIRKKVSDSLSLLLSGETGADGEADATTSALDANTLQARQTESKQAMLKAASELDFEKAVKHRDEMRRLEALLLELGS